MLAGNSAHEHCLELQQMMTAAFDEPELCRSCCRAATDLLCSTGLGVVGPHGVVTSWLLWVSSSGGGFGMASAPRDEKGLDAI